MKKLISTLVYMKFLSVISLAQDNNIWSLEMLEHYDKPYRSFIIIKNNGETTDSIKEVPTGTEIIDYYFLDSHDVQYITRAGFHYFYTRQKKFSSFEYKWRSVDDFSMRTFVPRHYETRPHVDHSFKFISASMVRDVQNKRDTFYLDMERLAKEHKETEMYKSNERLRKSNEKYRKKE